MLMFQVSTMIIDKRLYTRDHRAGIQVQYPNLINFFMKAGL